jgi:methionine synthase I (cobalamin-dependent)
MKAGFMRRCDMSMGEDDMMNGLLAKWLAASDEAILADGAMGTILFSMGLEQGSAPEHWNFDHPDRVGRVHEAYIAAGSRIILTNSFGGNRFRLALDGLGDRVREVNRAAAEIARRAAGAAGRAVVVAGSMGPTGGLFEPLGKMEYLEAVAAFEEQAWGLLEGGVDVFWIETMSDLREVRAALEGARRASHDLPATATMTFDTAGHTMMGLSPEEAVRALLEIDLLAVGANCGNGVEEILGVIEKMHAVDPDIPLIAKANAGIPTMEKGQPVYKATLDDMAEYALAVRDLGARIIGACCGSTAEHVRAMGKALKLAA